MNREKLLLAAGCAAFLATVGTAQTTTAPAPAAPGPLAPPYKNLQVLSKDITQAQLMHNMKFFAQSLGVRCVHCHVGQEGQPLSTFDFASDSKRAKLVARRMLAMVHRINEQEFGVRESKDVKVTCYTCHRGSTEPLTELPKAPEPSVSPETERGGT